MTSFTNDSEHPTAPPLQQLQPTPSNTSQTGSIPWPPVLEFSSWSLRNSVITCTNLGVEYQTSTSRALRYSRTTFTRRDLHSNTLVEVASWEKKTFGENYLRISPAGMVSDINAGLPREDSVFPEVLEQGSGFDFLKSFTASNGRRYIWKARFLKSLQLFRDDDPNVPVAVFLSRDLFHGELLNKIQLGPASGWEDILDYIVVTGVIAKMEAADKAQGDLRESLLREHIANPNHSINIALVEAAEKVVGMAGTILGGGNSQ